MIVAARKLIVQDLGVRPYAEVLSLQRELAADRINGTLEHDTLLLVQHPPVVTLGRRGEDNKLPVSAEFLASRGIDLFEVERGGGVTFHGPGQLVGYPIIDLRQHKQDLHWYLRQVEEVLIRALASYGVVGERSSGFTGVWTRGRMGEERDVVHGVRKIASIGVHARAWVTWHGFALNVTTDLSYFDLMTPCGIEGVVMTSIEREARELRPTVESVAETVASAFGDVFSLCCTRG